MFYVVRHMTGIAGAEANAQIAAMTCATCGHEMEHPRVVQVQDKLRMWCSHECVTPDPRDVLARQMAAWVRHMGHWTTLGDDAVVLAVASPEPAESVCITAGMIREATR